jgi:hypothetical protein
LSLQTQSPDALVTQLDGAEQTASGAAFLAVVKDAIESVWTLHWRSEEDFDACFILLRRRLRHWRQLPPVNVGQHIIAHCLVDFVSTFTPEHGSWYPLDLDEYPGAVDWFCEDIEDVQAMCESDARVVPLGLKTSAADAAAALLARLGVRGWEHAA